MADPRARAELPARPSRPIAGAGTYRLVLSYDGTDFHGWQRQPDRPTIQGEILDAARRHLGPEVRVTGASRTDAGVHALAQVASLVTTAALPPAAVQAALNAVLPAAIRVRAASEAAAGFDARRSASGKRYAYVIDNGPVASPLLRRFAWHVGVPLDLVAMRAALVSLRGRHDFSAFCAAPGRAVTPICRVCSVHVVRRRERVVVLVSADRFLHHMVRNIVGSAIEVGRGAREVGWVADLLQGRDRARAGPTAPAHGLALVRVLYPA